MIINSIIIKRQDDCKSVESLELWDLEIELFVWSGDHNGSSI